MGGVVGPRSSAATKPKPVNKVQGIGGRKQAIIRSKDGKDTIYTRIFTNGVKGPWIAADKPSTASPFPQLYLVRQEQKGGSRTQWSIVICDGDKNNYRGPTWQVKGDPNKGMTFFEVEDKKVLESSKFLDCTKLYQNVTADIKTKVTNACRSVAVPDPVADFNRISVVTGKKVGIVRDNQDWTCRALDGLLMAEIIDARLLLTIKNNQGDDRDLKAKNTFDQA